MILKEFLENTEISRIRLYVKSATGCSVQKIYSGNISNVSNPALHNFMSMQILQTLNCGSNSIMIYLDGIPTEKETEWDQLQFC